MKKKLFYILIGLVLLGSAGACKKATGVDGTFLKERSAKGKQEILDRLKEEPHVLFIKLPMRTTMIRYSKDTIVAATPLIFDFDTDAGVVGFRSYYGGLNRGSKFSIRDGIGAPILSFDTRSLISDIYTEGMSPIITDYMFRVIGMTDDFIELQSYRKGTIYSSEGGISFKMYRLSKLPEIQKWLSSDYNIFNHPQFLSPEGTTSGGKMNLKLTLEYVKPIIDPEGKEEKVSGEYYFFMSQDITDPAKASWYGGNRVRYSDLLGQRHGFVGAQSLNFYGGTSLTPRYLNNSYATFWGVNALFFAEYLAAPLFSKFGTPYLLVEEIGEKTIKLFAVDTNGVRSVTGTIELLEK